MTRDFGSQARFVVENYGESALAKRFGVTRYPAIFVDDVLVATPSDFGFYGKGEGKSGGRYAQIKTAASQERFRADLGKAMRAVLAGRPGEVAAQAASTAETAAARVPAFSLKDLADRPLTGADLAGKVTVVEFWATWCPPCRGTLGWLQKVAQAHPDAAVLALSVESPEAEVRKIAAELPGVRMAQGTEEAVRAFGDVSAVPTLLVYDRDGRLAKAFYGAPPGLHDEAERLIATLTAAR